MAISGWTRAKKFFILSAIILFILVVVGVRVYPIEHVEPEKRELYRLSLAGILILDAAFLAEFLGVAVAIMELVFGVFSSFLGITPGGVLGNLGMIGGVLLMFVVGSEVELDILRKKLRSSVAIGLTSFLVPALTSFIILCYMGLNLAGSWLVSISISTTSVAVVHAILLDKGLINRDIGQAILASAMIADAASIIALALAIVEATLMIVAYGILFIIIPAILRIALHHAPSRPGSQIGVRLIISTLLVLTLFSEIVGVHAALIAFILGLSTSDIIRKRGFLNEKLQGLVFGFFSPLFFFAAGLYVKPEGLSQLIYITLVLLAISYIPKVVGTTFSIKRALGVSDPLIGIMFGARLTVSTIAALIGLNADLIPQNYYSAIVLSAILATVASGVVAGKISVLHEEEI